jgi:hypothetical protein
LILVAGAVEGLDNSKDSLRDGLIDRLALRQRAIRRAPARPRPQNW